MSVKLMAQVWGLKLRGGRRDVLMAMADHAHDNGRCFPGIDYLAWKTDYSERQVQRIMRALEAEGLVEVLSGGKGAGDKVWYQLHLDRGVRKDPFVPKGKGDKMSPIKGDKMSPIDGGRVTSEAEKGDTAMAPEPKATTSNPGTGETVPSSATGVSSTPSPTRPAKKKDKKPPPVKGDPDGPPLVAWELAELLAASVGRRFPQFGPPKVGVEWARDIDLLMRKGPPGYEQGLEERQVRKLIVWLDEQQGRQAVFWGRNIRSAKKLRAHAPDLVADWFEDHGLLPDGTPNPNGNGHRGHGGRPDRVYTPMPITDPQAEDRAPIDPVELRAWTARRTAELAARAGAKEGP